MLNMIQVGKESGLIAFWLQISLLLAAVKELCFQQAETDRRHTVLARTLAFGFLQLMHHNDEGPPINEQFFFFFLIFSHLKVNGNRIQMENRFQNGNKQ